MKVEYNEYDNFRWINLNRWNKAKEVEALVDHLLEGCGSRKGRGYRVNMTALVLDLYQSYLCDPEQYIAYSRVGKSYQDAGEDHPYVKNPKISYDYLIGCVDHLITEKLVENRKGGRFYDEESEKFHSYVSRMRGLSALMTLVEEYGVTPCMLSAFALEDVVILKGKGKVKKGAKKKRTVKPRLKCPNNKAVKNMTSIIRQYNSLLERSQVDVDIECLTEEDRKALVDQLADMNVVGTKRIVLCLSKKSVYRVFNNGSLEQGGRYYGAWWISAPGVVRKYITINGDPTVELDFSAMHIHLLYAVKGVNYADKMEDAYTLPAGKYSLDNPDDDRAFNKLILLTAFNAETTELATSGVFDQLRREHKLASYGVRNHNPIKTRLSLLKEKHPLISDLIASGFGLKLQYWDSCIVEQVIKHFTSKGIPVLTVHDSVICQTQYAEEVTNVMLRYFYQIVEQQLKLSVNPVPKYSYANSALNRWADSFNFNVNVAWSWLTRIMDLKTITGYKPTITDIVPNTLNVKSTSRSNSCNTTCNHYIRLINKLKYQPNIKIELKPIKEAYSGVIVIR